jgi:16S rRNA G966 N2-methylase RsmD
MKIQINERFRSLIPPLAPEELQQLEANIIADGCRDPLVVWGETLVDGHNRLVICEKHGIQFRTSEARFADEDEACVWIIRNQFGRRNLAPFSRVELALALEPLLRKQAKEKQGRRNDLAFVCSCGETFNAKVWHCQKCDHHWPMDRDDCWNCHQGKRSNSEKATAVEQDILAKLPKSDTRADLAKLAGVGDRTISAGKLVAEHADEATKQRLRENQVSIHRVAKDIKEARQREERQKKRIEAAEETVEMDSRIIVGDFRKNADMVPDGSVSLIFTDPPYDREASKMLPELAEFAKRKLADGGSLVLYVGQTQLPAALDALRNHLRYWWTIACVHSGRSTVMREYGINAGWKAVLWFVKGTRDDNSVMVSDVMSGGEEKSHHDWQQSESEAAYWIEKLCPKDGFVCDPFLGGGTTAAAATKLSRKWVAFELNEESAKIASGRVAK